MTPGDLGEYGSRGISGTAMRGARLHIESGTVIRILIIRIITVTTHIILRTGLSAMNGEVSGLLPPIQLRGTLLRLRAQDVA